MGERPTRPQAAGTPANRKTIPRIHHTKDPSPLKGGSDGHSVVIDCGWGVSSDECPGKARAEGSIRVFA